MSAIMRSSFFVSRSSGRLALALVLLVLPLSARGQAPLDGGLAATVQESGGNEEAEEGHDTPGKTDDSSADGGNEEAENDHQGFSVRLQSFLGAARALVYWELFEGRLTIRAGGSLQFDGTEGKANDLLEQSIGEINSGFDVRRFRVFARGDVDEHLRYKASIDFGVDAGLKDFYMEGIDKGLNVWGYDIGKFRLGKFMEPFSMERRTGRHSQHFLERSLPVWTFAPGRNVGYMLHDATKGKRVSWQVGFFSFGRRDEDNASASALSVTARMTWLPIYKDHGNTLLHVGASYSTREPRNNEVIYRSRPEARFVDVLVDTGPIISSKSRLAGIEIAVKKGSWWAHSEWIQATIESAPRGDPVFWGAFIQAGYFFTGESRPYNPAEGIWGRVDPITGNETGTLIRDRASLRSGGKGALEIAGRISNLDLNDGLVQGGYLTNYSMALNWYPTHDTRWTLNYIYSDVKDGGNANIVLLRFQYSLH